MQNDFGDTTLAVPEPLAAGPHRLSSVSGRLEVTATPAALDQLPVVLATSYGTVRTDAPQDQFQDFSFTTGEGEVRAWRGFRRVADKARDAAEGGVFGLIDGLQGKTTLPGLVIQNRAGPIVFNLRKAP